MACSLPELSGVPRGAGYGLSRLEKIVEIQSFMAPEGSQLRVMDRDGEPWFVASDVCRCLELGNTAMAISRLDDDERGISSIDTHGVQEFSIVSEAGLYSLVLGSRKPEAKAFKRWVTHDVLPSIRRTGGYTIPRTYTEALRLAADQAERIEAQARQIELQAPAVAFVDRYVEAKATQPIRAVAKILGMREKDFIASLEASGIMYRLSGKLVPAAEHVQAGRFEVKAGEAHGHAYTQTRFTPNGIEWIAQRVQAGKIG